MIGNAPGLNLGGGITINPITGTITPLLAGSGNMLPLEMAANAPPPQPTQLPPAQAPAPQPGPSGMLGASGFGGPSGPATQAPITLSAAPPPNVIPPPSTALIQPPLGSTNPYYQDEAIAAHRAASQAPTPQPLVANPPAPTTADQQLRQQMAPGSSADLSAVMAALRASPAGQQGTVAPAASPSAASTAARAQPPQAGVAPFEPPDSAGVNLPIGLRLNNPLNLKAVPGQPFVDPQNPADKSGFGNYPDMASGVAGAVHQLGLYGQRGINTVHSIVSTWAPANDGNNPENYSAFVASKMGVDPNAPLNLQDPKTVSSLVGAMAQMETGRPLPPDVLASGVTAGLTGQPPAGAQIVPTAATADNGGFIGLGGGIGGNHSAFLDDIMGRMNKTIDGLQPIVVPPVTQSQQLMALASGLLSGRSLGQGLSRGLQGVNALQMANRQGQIQQAQLNNQQTLAKAGLLGDQARTALMMRPRLGYPMTDPRTGQTVQTVMYADGSMGFQPLGNLKTAPQQRVDLQGERLAAQTGGTIAGATAGAKADQEELTDLLHDGPVALQTIQNDAKMRAALNQGGAIMGPGTLNAFKRWAVEQGFPVQGVNQDEKSYLMALINQQKTANVGLMKTAVGSRVTNIEAKMGAAQGITPEMTKEAADAILDLQDLRSSVDAQVYKAYSSDPNIKQTIAAAGGMRAWRAAQETKLLANQTGQLRDSPAAPGSPLPQVNPDGSYTSVGPSGQKITVTVLH